MKRSLGPDESIEERSSKIFCIDDSKSSQHGDGSDSF